MKVFYALCCCWLLLACSAKESENASSPLPKKEKMTSEQLGQIVQPYGIVLVCYPPNKPTDQLKLSDKLFSFDVTIEGRDQELTFSYLFNNFKGKYAVIKGLEHIQPKLEVSNPPVKWGTQKDPKNPLAIQIFVDDHRFTIERFSPIPDEDSKNLTEKRRPFIYFQADDSIKFPCGISFQDGDPDPPREIDETAVNIPREEKITREQLGQVFQPYGIILVCYPPNKPIDQLKMSDSLFSFNATIESGELDFGYLFNDVGGKYLSIKGLEHIKPEVGVVDPPVRWGSQQDPKKPLTVRMFADGHWFTFERFAPIPDEKSKKLIEKRRPFVYFQADNSVKFPCGLDYQGSDPDKPKD
jgi:hypothetical protein